MDPVDTAFTATATDDPTCALPHRKKTILIRTYLRQLRTAALREDVGQFSPRSALSIIFCSFKYGVSPKNYREFGFGFLDNEARSQYFTHRHSSLLIGKANDPEAVSLVLDKWHFHQAYSILTKRRTLSLEDASRVDISELFRSSAGGVLLKPRLEGQGRGIVALTESDVVAGGRIEQIIRTEQRQSWIVDERLVQHSLMSEWFGAGMVPVRLVTGVTPQGRSRVIWGSITLGVGGEAVNYYTGGIMAPMDVSTGQVIGPGFDKGGRAYDLHPISGVKLADVVVPFWDDVLELAAEAAAVQPSVRYCGWDIGITEDGPFLIEGNHDPGTYARVQSYLYRGHFKGGHLPLVQKVFPDLL